MRQGSLSNFFPMYLYSANQREENRKTVFFFVKEIDSKDKTTAHACENTDGSEKSPSKIVEKPNRPRRFCVSTSQIPYIAQKNGRANSNTF